MEYAARTPRSRRLRAELEQALPGGDTRSVTFFAPYPVVIESGRGCELVDVDGNRYLDFLNNYTALAHGHAHPAIVRAIVDAAPRGTVFPAPHRAQAALAEELARRVRSVEQVRFTNSGSEAVMLAIRAARAFTGRELVVKAEGGYHGSWEQVPASVAERRGVPRALRELVRFVGYNDAAALEAVMASDGPRVAAILLEPVLGEGMIAGDPAFFARARELATRHGALLVLDEVVTARLAVGGYQAVLGVEPDLTTFGKIVGGGLPVGAVGGSAAVMSVFDPHRQDAVPHSGTFNGNPLTMAAGRVSLELLTAEQIARISDLGATLAAGLREALAERRVPGGVAQCGSLAHLQLEPATVARLHLACMEEGLFIAPRGMLNTSTAMTQLVVADAVARFGRAMDRVADVAVGVGSGGPAGGGPQAARPDHGHAGQPEGGLGPV